MRYLGCLLVFLWAATAGAQEGLPPVPAGEDVIVSLKTGYPAPFNGQLFDNNTAIRWGLWLQQYKERLELEQERGKAVCNIEVNYRDRLATIEIERATVVYQDLMGRFKVAEEGRLKAEHTLASPPWYRSGTFQFTLGVLTTVTVVFVAKSAF